MVKPTRLVAVFVVAAMLAVTGHVARAPQAAAETGDCVTVKGKGGTRSKGYAIVCLTGFYITDGKQHADITVQRQRRRSAPRNVYVKYSFKSGSVVHGLVRLGPNSNKMRSYATTKTNNNRSDLDGVQFQLCYDVPLKADPCFRKKSIVASWSAGPRG